MNHERRGVALVINIRSYNPNPYKLQERKWSAKDVENLKKTLNYLEFQVVLCQDLTKGEIEQVLLEQALVDHCQSDCFLCVVMSHGNEDKIVASDNEEISFEDIMAPIKQCKSLINKPKLFFFQACRGEKAMEEASLVESRPCSAMSTISGGHPCGDGDHTQNNTKTNVHTLNTNKKTQVQAESDLLVFNATLPKHLAYGTEKDGTVFIKNVCEVFTEAYKNIPNNTKLSQMVLNINSKVKEYKFESDEKQLSVSTNILTKDVHFLPKNVSAFFNAFKRFQ